MPFCCNLDNLIVTGAKKVLEGLGVYTNVIPSVEIELNDYSTSTPGAWHIDKEAEWTERC